MADRVVEEYLQSLADKNDGRLDADMVVKAARSPRSPIHDRFTWDDEEAAAKQRIAEARALIRSIKLVVINKDVTFEVPKYVRDPEARSHEQGYVAVVKLRGESDLARSACLREFERAREALRRAQSLSAYFGLEDQVQQGLELIQELYRRAQEARPEGSA